MNSEITQKEETDEQLLSLYQTVAYYTDLAWGKSRFYLQPMWSTKYDASQITDNIYISDLASAFNLDRLKIDGITHIINLVLGIDSIYPENFTYLNIPVRDVIDQNISQYFDECLTFMNNAIQNNGKVLVHCSYGVSRSASIVIAYLIKHERKTFSDALNYTKSKRHVIQPNEGFVEQLKEFANKCMYNNIVFQKLDLDNIVDSYISSDKNETEEVKEERDEDEELEDQVTLYGITHKISLLGDDKDLFTSF